MIRGTRPPPLNLSPPPTAQTTTSTTRTSRFIEPPMHEYTPPLNTNSIFEEDDEPEPTAFMTALRIVNDGMHILACVVLVLIMAFFLAAVPDALSRTTGREAVALIVFLGIDIILDVFSIAQYPYRKGMPGWALFLRLAIGVSYIAVFMVYVAIGRVFPSDYSYWGLPRGYEGPIVYLFLWLIGVWNLLLMAIYRHQFGRELRRYFQAARGTRQSHTGPSSASRGVIVSRWRRRGGASDLEAGNRRMHGAGRNRIPATGPRVVGNAITLAHRPAESKASVVSASTIGTASTAVGR